MALGTLARLLRGAKRASRIEIESGSLAKRAVRKHIGATNTLAQSSTAGMRAVGKARRQVKKVDDAISETLSGLRDAGSAATIGGNLIPAAKIGLGLGAANFAINDFQEKFGGQLSGAANFALGAVKTTANIGFGMKAVTHLGRAGILARGKFGGIDSGFSKLKSSLSSAHSNLHSHKRAITSAREQVVSAQKQARVAIHRGKRTELRTTVDKRLNELHEELVLTTPTQRVAGRPTLGAGRTGQRIGREYTDTRKAVDKARQQVAGAQRSIKTSTQKAIKTKKTAKRTLNRISDVIDNGTAKSLKLLQKNQKQIDQFAAFKKSQEFTASKMALGALKMPFAMGGAMLGRGALFGKADPAMQYVGKAMGIATISGLGAGVLVGGASASMRNLGPAQGPMQRQGGRSFSNISHNAALHAHRINR